MFLRSKHSRYRDLAPTIEDIKYTLSNMSVSELDKYITPSVKKSISVIKQICESEYDDQRFYGGAALNRKILLDREISRLLTPQTILGIFALQAKHKKTKGSFTERSIFQILRNTTATTLADILYYGFKEGLDVIEKMPNNEEKYGLKRYHQQKNDFSKHTLTIVGNMITASRLLGIKPIAYKKTQNKSLMVQLNSIEQIIDRIKVDGNSDKLLYVPSFTANQIRMQAMHGFKLLCDAVHAETEVKENKNSIAKIKIIRPSTLKELVKTIIHSESVLLDGYISHIFYDRTHLEACIASDKKIRIGDHTYNLRDIIREIVAQCEQRNNSIAYEQFSIRLHLIDLDLRMRFPDTVKITEFEEAGDLPPKILREKYMTSLFKYGKHEDVEKGIPKESSVSSHSTIESGPLNKNRFTYYLEKIIKSLLAGEKYKFEIVDNALFAIDTKGVKYNLSEILKYANFNHIQLSKRDLDAYPAFLENLKKNYCTHPIR